jgi:REP element-mobilizing transposase RayT
VFRTDKLKAILCDALNEAPISAGMLFFAYVIMIDHFHIITDGKRSPSETLRYLNGITARRIIGYLRENNFEASLAKIRQSGKNGGYRHSLWEHHSDKFLITSESKFMEKVSYIHNNPMAEGLAEGQLDYQYSSARIWRRNPLEQEPLEMNIDQIQWRQSLPRFQG